MWITPPIDLQSLPREPGVYRMHGHGGKVIYVGKARNLRKRIGSYFQRRPESPRIEAMVSQVTDVSYTVTNSESEALILEQNLIKQLSPRYNVLLKDAKSYPYIVLTDEPFPRLMFHRGAKDRPGEYFGPFANAGAVHACLQLMQKVFLLRDCENTAFRNRTRPCLKHQIGRCTAPCCGLVDQAEYARQVEDARRFLKGEDERLIQQWQTEMNDAAQALDFEKAAQLRDRIRTLRAVLARTNASELPPSMDGITIIRHGDAVAVAVGTRRNGHELGTYVVPVRQAARAGDEEVLQAFFCERYRFDPPPELILLDSGDVDVKGLKRVLHLLHPSQKVKIAKAHRKPLAEWILGVRKTGECMVSGRSLTDQTAALEDLARLFCLDKTPEIIACIDIAHLGGRQASAAIVYAGPQGPLKEYYRHFKVKGVAAGDDYGAITHVLGRFFRRILKEEIPMPDILLVDGGRGQLECAMQQALEFGLSQLRIVAVAKGKKRKVGEETLWPGWTQDGGLNLGEAIRPGAHSPALMLIARVRDEAHRFAGRYMRMRKKKSMFTSSLEGIPGIGPAKRTRLLSHFGGIQGVKEASVKQLAAVPGISQTLAERIFAALHR